MIIHHKIYFQSGLLKVDASGEFSLEAAKRAFLNMLGAVVQYKAEKILFDVRNVRGTPTDMERFCYGDFVARATHRIVREHGIVPRVAYLAHVPLRDPERFAETVAVNRGGNVKSFETPEDAFEWLECSPADESDAATLEQPA